jgi:hypothetical protein
MLIIIFFDINILVVVFPDPGTAFTIIFLSYYNYSIISYYSYDIYISLFIIISDYEISLDYEILSDNQLSLNSEIVYKLSLII